MTFEPTAELKDYIDEQLRKGFNEAMEEEFGPMPDTQLSDQIKEFQDVARQHGKWLDSLEAGNYCIVSLDIEGEDDEINHLYFVTEYNALSGATTESNIANAKRWSLKSAAEVMRSIVMMDKHYWPPVNPVIGRIEDGHIVALVAKNMTDEGIAFIHELADKHGLKVEHYG